MRTSVYQAGRILRFLAAGIPAFAAALLTNLLLVERLHWPKPVSYIVVLCLQVTINFFACRLFVFNVSASHSVPRQYFSFLRGTTYVRVFEWLFYTILVEVFRFPYMLVQLGSILVFSVLKFKFAESIFESRARKASLVAQAELQRDGPPAPGLLRCQNENLIRPEQESPGRR